MDAAAVVFKYVREYRREVEGYVELEEGKEVGVVDILMCDDNGMTLRNGRWDELGQSMV